MIRENNREPLPIGDMIRRTMYAKGLSVEVFADKICMQRANVYNIFKRYTISTDLLLRISVILETDFFRYYSSEYSRIKQNGNEA